MHFVVSIIYIYVDLQRAEPDEFITLRIPRAREATSCEVWQPVGILGFLAVMLNPPGIPDARCDKKRRKVPQVAGLSQANPLQMRRGASKSHGIGGFSYNIINSVTLCSIQSSHFHGVGGMTL